MRSRNHLPNTLSLLGHVTSDANPELLGHTIDAMNEELYRQIAHNRRVTKGQLNNVNQPEAKPTLKRSM